MRILLSLAMFLLPVAGVSAQEALPSQLKTTLDKASYGIGVNIARDLQEAGFDVNLVIKGLQDVLAKREPLLDDEARQAAIAGFQQEHAQKVADMNKKAGAEFAARFKNEKDVKTLPGGIHYQVLKTGDGKTPKESDQVTVHYRGVLVDGRQFDSSYDRGAPTSFAVDEVIDGWTQVLQRMKVGDKWKVVIPSDLAYGETGFGPVIGPNATLVFEIELLSVDPKAEKKN